MGRNFHLEDVTWHIAFNQSQGTIQGDVVNTVTPLMDTIDKVALNEGKLTISKVTVNGDPATFTVDAAHEQMIVSLPKPASRGDHLKIEISYTGKPEAGLYFVNPDRSAVPIKTNVVYTQGEAEDNRYWLPTYDEPEDKATSESYISVPKGFFALSNGTLVDVQHIGDDDVFHWKIDQPHSTYLNSFVAAKLAVGSENWDGLSVDWYVPDGAEEMGAPTFGGTADMVRFYSDLTGVKYPYSKFAQTAVPDFPFGGMENITAVTQTIEALHPAAYSATNDTRGLVLHELAHQWFGDLETCDSWPNNWLNEGFATFLPHFYFRHADGDDAYQIGKLQDLETAAQAMQMHARPMVETKYNVPMDLFDGHAYGGGAARLFALQSLLGEKVFWAGIHQFLTEYAYKPVNTDQFFDCMSRATGKDLSWFDKEYFHTAALPSVTLTRSGSTVTLTQKDPAFTLDLDFWELSKGDWKKSTVSLHGASSEVKLENPEDPLVLDPLVNWPVTIKYLPKFTAEQLGELYKQAPNAAQKMRLAEQALDSQNSALVAKLAVEEPSKDLRRELAKMTPLDQGSALLKLSHDPDVLVRIAAFDQMAGASKPEFEQREREVWMSTALPDERSAALQGLLRGPDGADYAGKAYHAKSFRDELQISALNWYRFNRPDKARALSLKLLSGNADENLRLAAISVLGGVRDAKGQTVAFHELINRLSDKSLHEKQSAILALMSYGDPKAVPELHKLDDFSMYQIRVLALSAESQLSK